MSKRPTYKDEPSPRESGSSSENHVLHDVEMQERDDSYDDEEEQDRLLSDGQLMDAVDIRYKVEWHLRTGWAIALSVVLAGLVFSGMVLFTKYVIVSDRKIEVAEALQSGIGSFRRPASDYILDPNWNVNAAPKVREYQWKITDIVANPDGVFRPMLTVDGRFPGPMIECNQGDTLVIEVDNQSENATSLHFHGLFQNGTNWMDGTTGVTQCPIAPKRKFRYEFTVNGQSGTYYYHGHQAVQLSDGLYGPLVIHSKDEKKLQQIPYASDRVVMLQDYYHELSSGLLKASLEPGSEASPIPNGALINGLNRRDCSRIPDKLCDNSTTIMPSFDLEANANHRLRFINVGAFAWFQVEVDEHEFDITEVDGTDIVPSRDTRLMISPAQRYSMIVNTNLTTADSFWLRARMVTHCWKDPQLPGPGADEVKAIIQYTTPSRPQNALLTQPTTRGWSKGMEVQCKDMNTTSYIPLPLESEPPEVAHHSYYIRSNLEIGNWRLERGFFNTSTFRPNLKQPTLHRTIDGLSTQNETFTRMANTDGVNAVAYDQKNDFLIQHSGVKTVDLIIQNFDEGNHPMHLHGHKFWVLGQGHGMFPGYATLGLQDQGKGLLAPVGGKEKFRNIISRDVATAEGFGWIALRFVADNPGVWAFHCHMAWHSEAGMVMQFLSRVDEVANWEVPVANRELCDAAVTDLEKGAPPKDETWFGFGIGG